MTAMVAGTAPIYEYGSAETEMSQEERRVHLSDGILHLHSDLEVSWVGHAVGDDSGLECHHWKLGQHGLLNGV